jgi:hypothetical protein
LDDYQTFIHRSRYARWRDEDNRRETWEETVQRLINYYGTITGIKKGDYEDPILFELYDAIVNLEVMPSMRALMTAGPALDRCNVGAYNCAYLPVDSPRSFDEAMYILMCGTGVGFSVESKYVEQLPRVSEVFSETSTTIVVEIAKKDGPNLSENLSPYLLRARYPNGTHLVFDPLVPDLRLSEDEHQDLTLLYDYLSSVLTHLRSRLDDASRR